ncbi:PAS domain-containing protein [Rhizobium sp. 32-5/1]|uniref:helix-turn-helix transcriptional regulator n=1 Tax=Rhizobium sp. 32-5/1 TaxID=3019602 RepID=UPI00240D5BDA|nr:PAS domain-containing protein [Rhizobium sp. 32-5/1]WEZ82392.1 PAS domain-containing protein [Rhizobium sp. 32-5/1]
MKPELVPFAAVCDGIAQLFQPFVEVVLHDLETETAAHIAGNFSKREIGEPSLLNEIDFRPIERILGPYEKVNWDGRRIKSISIILRDANDRPIAVLCINADVSHFHAVMQTLSAFASVPVDHDKPASLFKEDWHERINEYIQNWTTSRALIIANLTRDQKQQLVKDLSADGAFGGRNAAAYISRVLGMGRATVYKYLNQERAADE